VPEAHAGTPEPGAPGAATLTEASPEAPSGADAPAQTGAEAAASPPVQPRRPLRGPAAQAAAASAAAQLRPDGPPAGWPRGFAEAMGWLPAGPVLVRLDVAERIAGELAYLTRRAPAPPPSDLASRLGVKADALGNVLGALGFRLLEPAPLAEDAYGPPTPLRVAQLRARHVPDRRGGPQRQQRRGAGAGPGMGQGAGPGASQGTGHGAPGGKWQRDQGEGRGRRRHAGPPGDRPREGAPDQPRAARTDQSRPQGAERQQDRPPGAGPRPDRQPQDRQQQGSGPRQDRRWPERRARPGDGGGPDGAPRRDGGPQGGSQGRPPPKERAPDPDSPFAVLARLKLR
jgi:ATP-dependent RNA helicase SUPV3L1/SUV3